MAKRLTRDDVAHGRDLSVFDMTGHDFSDWLLEHAEALLDAAERVAQSAEAAAQEDRRNQQLDDFDRESEQKAEVWRVAAEQAAEAERTRARAYFERLRPAFTREFQMRPLVSDAQADSCSNPRAFAPKQIRAWFDSRGLQATVRINPTDPRDLLVDPLRVRFEHGDAET
jgi:hypothetical protein